MTDARFAEVARLAQEASIQLMTHLVVSEERRLLLNREFKRLMTGVRLRSYVDL
jgi:hypothetical protein